MIFRILIVAALSCLAVAAAPAKTARQIEERFLAPCCWSESVAFHNSPAAKDMRAEIEQFVAAGKSEQEIVDHYVGLHGERILREPRGSKLIWLIQGPILALLTGCVGLVIYVRRLRKQPAPPVVATGVLPEVEDDLDW